MSIARHMVVFLVALLMSWGGMTAHASMAMAAPPASASMADTMALHMGGHLSGDHGTVDDGAMSHHDHSTAHDGHGGQSAMPNCCPFACGMATVLPAPTLGVADAGWDVVRLPVSGDELMAGRSVSPLRRPPRQRA